MTRPNLTVQIQRLPGNDDIPLPHYQSDHAAAMDLHAAVTEPTTLAPGKIVLIPCGFAMAVPEGYEAQIRPRSGLALKHGISIPNAPGTIDADYRGHVQVILINHSSEPFTINRADRIAQMLITPVPKVQWHQVPELTTTTRGSGGFGHTGS